MSIKIKTHLYTFFVGLTGALLGSLIYRQVDNDSLAYVRSQELFMNYHGTTKAIEALNRQKKVWQAESDSLQSIYQKAIANRNEVGIGNDTAIQNLALELNEHLKLTNYKEIELDKKLMLGVFNQIDEFINQYAQKNGYQLVFGIGEESDVIYANDALDITEEILEELNSNYNGQ